MNAKPKRKNNTPQCPFCHYHDVTEKTIGLPDRICRCRICNGLWDSSDAWVKPTFVGHLNVLRHNLRQLLEVVLKRVGL